MLLVVVLIEGWIIKELISDTEIYDAWVNDREKKIAQLEGDLEEALVKISKINSIIKEQCSRSQ